MDLGRLLLRGVVGPLFVGHGIEGTGGFFENLGLRPGKRHATAAGWAEAGGGALLTLGAFTPLASLLISSTMVTAIRKVHAPKGPWVTEGGYEYNVALIAAMAAITETGPGSPSVDAKLFPGLKGKGLALATLGAAVAGSYLVTEKLNQPAPAPEPQIGMDDPTLADQPRFEREPVSTEQTA